MNGGTADRLNERTPDLPSSEHRDKGTALLIIDMISDFDFEGGDAIASNALPAAPNIARLASRAREAKVPVIYVNDNFGEWKHDFRTTVELAQKSERGGPIVKLLEPRDEDYHILKPQRSGFFSTPLEVLLNSLKVSCLILTGVSTDICVLFTAHDAYMRGFELAVPPDCTAALDTSRHREAMGLLSRLTYADVTLSTQLELPAKSREHAKN